MTKHAHTEGCYSNYGGFREYLIHVAPSYLWADVQDVGSYQGRVYGIAYVEGKIALYEDYYGSCSGCGAWGEGGEPTTEKEVLDKSTFFTDPVEALAYVAKEWSDSYEPVDLDKVKNAIDEIAYRFLNYDWEKRNLIRDYKFTKEEKNV